MRHGLARTACLGLVLAVTGCFESSVPLGPVGRAEIDGTLVGTWRCLDPTPGSTSTATLSVTPFDERQYYAEWRDGDDVSRYRAYATRIGGRVLFNVRELNTGRASKPWIFLRARVDDKKALLLSVVRKEPLEKLTEAEAVRELKRRVADESLYGDFAVCTSEREGP